MLKSSMRFQPSIVSSWNITLGVTVTFSLGSKRMAQRAPVRSPEFTFSSTLRSGCTASMKPPKVVW